MLLSGFKKSYPSQAYLSCIVEAGATTRVALHHLYYLQMSDELACWMPVHALAFYGQSPSWASAQQTSQLLGQPCTRWCQAAQVQTNGCNQWGSCHWAAAFCCYALQKHADARQSCQDNSGGAHVQLTASGLQGQQTCVCPSTQGLWIEWLLLQAARVCALPPVVDTGAQAHQSWRW